MADDTARKKPLILTRQELYDRVWSSPMTKLAAEFGISDVGLIKICKRLDVVHPSRGYWAKKAAGKKVIQLLLPAPKEGTPPSATITPTPPTEPAPSLSKEIEAKVEAVRKEVAKVPVPDKLLRPHPIVAGWIAERADQRREARERRRLRGHGYDPGEFTEIERREHRIFDALFKAIERNGGKVLEGTVHGEIVEIGKEKIEFRIRQKQKQIRRPPTIEEKKQRWNRGKEVIIETITTDILVLEIRTYLQGRPADQMARNPGEVDGRSVAGHRRHLRRGRAAPLPAAVGTRGGVPPAGGRPGKAARGVLIATEN